MLSSWLPSSRSRNCTSAKGEPVGSGVIVGLDTADDDEADGAGVGVGVVVPVESSVFEQALIRNRVEANATALRKLWKN